MSKVTKLISVTAVVTICTTCVIAAAQMCNCQKGCHQFTMVYQGAGEAVEYDPWYAYKEVWVPSPDGGLKKDKAKGYKFRTWPQSDGLCDNCLDWQLGAGGGMPKVWVNLPNTERYWCTGAQPNP